MTLLADLFINTIFPRTLDTLPLLSNVFHDDTISMNPPIFSERITPKNNYFLVDGESAHDVWDGQAYRVPNGASFFLRGTIENHTVAGLPVTQRFVWNLLLSDDHWYISTDSLIVFNLTRSKILGIVKQVEGKIPQYQQLSTILTMMILSKPDCFLGLTLALILLLENNGLCFGAPLETLNHENVTFDLNEVTSLEEQPAVASRNEAMPANSGNEKSGVVEFQETSIVASKPDLSNTNDVIESINNAVRKIVCNGQADHSAKVGSSPRARG